MNRVTTRLILIVAALVVAAIAVFALGRMTARRGTRMAGRPLHSVPPHTAIPSDTGGGMAGMKMSTAGDLTLTANQIHQFGVTFGTAKVRTLDAAVRTVGTVTVDERHLTEVTPRFGGYVERLYVDETGQRVRQGQPLMDVYSPELVAAEQELLVAGKLQRSIGTSGVPGVPSPSVDLVDVAKRRFALWDISRTQVDAILRSGKIRRSLTLHAPASGVVLEKHVVQGQAITPGKVLYRIADLRDVWIDVALREQDAGDVREGTHAVVDLAAYPGRPITGRVAYVYPTLDSTARTVRARIQIANPAGRLRPGMYATVTLTTPTRRALTVPTSAVLATGTRTLVFMDMGGGHLMPMKVVTGHTAGRYTEILAGLRPGAHVVTSAQYLLDSESNLGEVMKSMIGQMNTSDMNRR